MDSIANTIDCLTTSKTGRDYISAAHAYYRPVTCMRFPPGAPNRDQLEQRCKQAVTALGADFVPMSRAVMIDITGIPAKPPRGFRVKRANRVVKVTVMKRSAGK